MSTRFFNLENDSGNDLPPVPNQPETGPSRQANFFETRDFLRGQEIFFDSNDPQAREKANSILYDYMMASFDPASGFNEEEFQLLKAEATATLYSHQFPLQPEVGKPHRTMLLSNIDLLSKKAIEERDDTSLELNISRLTHIALDSRNKSLRKDALPIANKYRNELQNMLGLPLLEDLKEPKEKRKKRSMLAPVLLGAVGLCLVGGIAVSIINPNLVPKPIKDLASRSLTGKDDTKIAETQAALITSTPTYPALPTATLQEMLGTIEPSNTPMPSSTATAPATETAIATNTPMIEESPVEPTLSTDSIMAELNISLEDHLFKPTRKHSTQTIAELIQKYPNAAQLIVDYINELNEDYPDFLEPNLDEEVPVYRLNLGDTLRFPTNVAGHNTYVFIERLNLKTKERDFILENSNNSPLLAFMPTQGENNMWYYDITTGELVNKTNENPGDYLYWAHQLTAYGNRTNDPFIGKQAFRIIIDAKKESPTFPFTPTQRPSQQPNQPEGPGGPSNPTNEPPQNPTVPAASPTPGGPIPTGNPIPTNAPATPTEAGPIPTSGPVIPTDAGPIPTSGSPANSETAFDVKNYEVLNEEEFDWMPEELKNESLVADTPQGRAYYLLKEIYDRYLELQKALRR